MATLRAWCLADGARARYLRPTRSPRHPRVWCTAHHLVERDQLGTIDPTERELVRRRAMRRIVRRALKAPWARA